MILAIQVQFLDNSFLNSFLCKDFYSLLSLIIEGNMGVYDFNEYSEFLQAGGLFLRKMSSLV